MPAAQYSQLIRIFYIVRWKLEWKLKVKILEKQNLKQRLQTKGRFLMGKWKGLKKAVVRIRI